MRADFHYGPELNRSTGVLGRRRPPESIHWCVCRGCDLNDGFQRVGQIGGRTPLCEFLRRVRQAFKQCCAPQLLNRPGAAILRCPPNIGEKRFRTSPQRFFIRFAQISLRTVRSPPFSNSVTQYWAVAMLAHAGPERLTAREPNRCRHRQLFGLYGLDFAAHSSGSVDKRGSHGPRFRLGQSIPGLRVVPGHAWGVPSTRGSPDGQNC